MSVKQSDIFKQYRKLDEYYRVVCTRQCCHLVNAYADDGFWIDRLIL